MIDALNENINFLPCKLSRNDLAHVIEAANPNMTSRVGLKYFLEILMPEVAGSGTFVSLHKSELREKPPYTLGGITFFEGAAVVYNRKFGKVDNILSVEKPKYGMLSPMVVTSQTKQIKLKEIVIGGTPVVNTSVTLPAFWVAKAGVSSEDFLAYGDTYFSEFQKESRRFLTNQPIQKVIGTNQTEYLSFLLNVNPMPSGVRLRIEKCYKSKRNKITSTVLTAISPSFMSVVVFPVNYTDLNLDCDYFNVWLADETNSRISEVRTYFVDKKYRSQERVIFYENSIGGWDTLRLVGEGTETIKSTQTYVKAEKSAYNLAEETLLRVVSADSDRELNVSTGYFQEMPRELLSSIEELLHSEAIYLSTKKGHQQLKRLTNSLVTKEDDNGNIARTLQFQFVNKPTNYSDLPAKDPTPLRAMKWIAFGNQKFILNANGKRTGYKTSESLIRVYVDDNSKVKPLQVVANVPGVEGYIESYFDNTVVVGSTPFPNAAINTFTTFVRQGCGVGFEGGPATINIAGGTYGGEVAGDADALAVAAANALNTQANANLNGPCNVLGPNYTASVPANHWHYRVKDPIRMSIWYKDIGSGSYLAGNINVQGQNGQYVYAPNSNGLNFPISGPPNYFGWRIELKGYVPLANHTLNFYKNNVLKYSRAITLDTAGELPITCFYDEVENSYPPNNGDLMFWEVV